MIFSFMLLPLAVQAKTRVPDQGVVFVLSRVVEADEKKISPNEVVPAGSKLRFRVEARKQPCTVVTSAFLRGNAREIPSLPPFIRQLQVDEQASQDFIV
ncbi:MAG: hypothetical protein KIS61_30850, partial [Candidatus Eremiobacteraeota bacterium]|nr:hypothetical protein [Candidatus Eremiobacteraeota bacterium]